MIMLVHKHTGDAGIVYLVPAYIIPEVLIFYKGNRDSKLGPVCGTWLPKAILLPTDKFWLSMFRVPAVPGQSSTGYRGFTLSFTQVLHPVHGSGNFN